MKERRGAERRRGMEEKREEEEEEKRREICEELSDMCITERFVVRFFTHTQTSHTQHVVLPPLLLLDYVGPTKYADGTNT